MLEPFEQQLSDRLHPVASPQFLDDPYTEGQFQRMMRVTRDNGRGLMMKCHFDSIEEILASLGGTAELEVENMSLDSLVTQVFRGFFAEHGIFRGLRAEGRALDV